MQTRLLEIYDALLHRYGHTGWWPADTTFEIVLGAFLTQNTSWTNVEKALGNLRGLCALDPEPLWNLPTDTLKDAIRPAGYYNQKAKRLRGFLQVLFHRYGGRLEHLFRLPTQDLRMELIGIKGIGPETADCILLYAAERPVFVIDAYTIRILSRHALLPEDVTYDEAQRDLMDHLPDDIHLFKEYHALLVHVGKDHCRPKPKCPSCPLEALL